VSTQVEPNQLSSLKPTKDSDQKDTSEQNLSSTWNGNYTKEKI